MHNSEDALRNTILRLVLWVDCARGCPLCCNRQFAFEHIPVCNSYAGYKEILLTGGEPMLHPDLVRKTIEDIRRESTAPIYLYTADVTNIPEALSILGMIDGMTVTLHSKDDLGIFSEFDDALYRQDYGCWAEEKSLRLKAFGDIIVDPQDFPGWDVRSNLRWLPKCPLPEGEVLMKSDHVLDINKHTAPTYQQQSQTETTSDGK